jgi:nucleotide-binding universal stress UspA family protein
MGLTVLVPVDESPCSVAAVDAVVRQFDPRTTEVHVLHVVEWPRGLPMSLAYGEGPTAAVDLLGSRDRAFEAGRSVAARQSERLEKSGFQVTAHAEGGEAREAILQAAARLKADLIMIGSHGRRGLDRILLGSVSEGVLRRATCAVEIVKAPAGSGEGSPKP